ncbi:MAG: hypothetical protein J6S91_08740 [Treponema sp.]|nr:hypothetical protein [Treponema sp.]
MTKKKTSPSWEELTFANNFLFCKIVEATENLLKMGLGTYEQIAQAQGLSLEQVQEIAERLAVKA